jgi:hypothetical protein
VSSGFAIGIEEMRHLGAPHQSSSCASCDSRIRAAAGRERGGLLGSLADFRRVRPRRSCADPARARDVEVLLAVRMFRRSGLARHGGCSRLLSRVWPGDRPGSAWMPSSSTTSTSHWHVAACPRRSG